MSSLEYRTVPGFSDYIINKYGRVWNKKGKRFLKPVLLKSTGYFKVGITNDEGKYKNKTIHQLIAMAFLGHKPDGHNVVVDHIDNNPSNNRLDNLQLVSNRENSSKDVWKIKKSGLPLGISFVNGYYIFSYWYGSKQYKWALRDLEQAIEFKELFNFLVEVDGEEYAITTLDKNRRGVGKRTKAEINGQIKIK